MPKLDYIDDFEEEDHVYDTVLHTNEKVNDNSKPAKTTFKSRKPKKTDNDRNKKRSVVMSMYEEEPEENDDGINIQALSIKINKKKGGRPNMKKETEEIFKSNTNKQNIESYLQNYENIGIEKRNDAPVANEHVSDPMEGIIIDGSDVEDSSGTEQQLNEEGIMRRKEIEQALQNEDTLKGISDNENNRRETDGTICVILNQCEYVSLDTKNQSVHDVIDANEHFNGNGIGHDKSNPLKLIFECPEINGDENNTSEKIDYFSQLIEKRNVQLSHLQKEYQEVSDKYQEHVKALRM